MSDSGRRHTDGARPNWPVIGAVAVLAIASAASWWALLALARLALGACS
mgnify:CR=1 FL=1